MQFIIFTFIFTLLSFQLVFAYFNIIHLKKKYRMNHLKMNVCYPDNDDEFNDRKNILFNDYDKDIYTLIWYDCPKCKELLDTMEELKLQHNYINGGIYFYDITDEKSESNSPLFYKDDKFIGDNLFDIYYELYNTI